MRFNQPPQAGAQVGANPNVDELAWVYSYTKMYHTAPFYATIDE